MFHYQFSQTDAEGKERILLQGTDPVVFASSLSFCLRKEHQKIRQMVAQMRSINAEQAQMIENALKESCSA